ncbi:Uncharacterised protein [Mycobacteroides abscessus subsp. abscessus]|nr:Uncharacterised protein [Mycobacteroides abscessus subsp. abscessus]
MKNWHKMKIQSSTMIIKEFQSFKAVQLLLKVYTSCSIQNIREAST